MREAGVGRVLVASLHQGISDVLPTRLGFYEGWLNTTGLRDGTIGLAPLYAVLSFLRQEGDAYDAIAARAGRYAAEWTVESMTSFERALIMAAPPWLRVRLLLVVAGRLVRRSYGGSRAVSSVKGRIARVSVSGSVFCSVREPVVHPLCGYYAAAFSRLLTLFELPATAVVVACRGAGASDCVLDIPLAGSQSASGQEADAA